MEYVLTFHLYVGARDQSQVSRLACVSYLAAPGSGQQKYNEKESELWTLLVKKENA